MELTFSLSEAPSPLMVFISSTYYDLRSVRQELADYLSELGFEPVLFESAGALPSMTAPLSAIHHASQADVCILIIGSRYGTVSDEAGAISWTHAEYRTARDLGKPIFIFIERDVLVQYELYRNRSDSSFWKPEERSLFSFVQEVSVFGSRFPFISLPELKTALRFQLSSYFGYLVRRYSKLDAIHSTNAVVWRRIGSREAKRGEFGKAVFCYREALSLDPKNKYALSGLSTNLLQLGRFEEAEQIARDAISLFPKLPRFRGLLCQILRDSGRLQDALTEAEALVELYPDDDRIWDILSLIHERLGNQTDAVKAARKAIEVAPGSRDRRYRLHDIGNGTEPEHDANSVEGNMKSSERDERYEDEGSAFDI